MPLSRRDDEVQPQRRQLLRAGAAALVGLQLPWLVACQPRVGTAAAGGGVATSAYADLAMADGGTALLAKAGAFPNPFAAAAATACQLTCEMTVGPCHALSPQRSDISDGLQGLPMRMQLRIVDAACAPVADAIVEVWHTNQTGGYSGEGIQRMCTQHEADKAAQFFRGYQRTDANGVVSFDTCYPGWYRGRAVHVHLRVMRGDYAADDRAPASVVTQLLFPDALNAQVFARHPLYAPNGQPDTHAGGGQRGRWRGRPVTVSVRGHAHGRGRSVGFQDIGDR